MANHVRVSTIGIKYHPIDPGVSLNEAVRIMANHLREKINQTLPDRPDFILLPECCDKPANYTWEKCTDFFKERGTIILELLSSMAKDNHCYIAYPAYWQMSDGSWRNSIHILDRSGEIIGEYHKNHPTLSEMEIGVQSGKDALLIQCDFGSVACALCFDLNFDQLRQEYVKAKPDLIIFSSMYHGGLMQQYWAYSCRAHFISAISNTFPSSIISPVGHMIQSNTNYFDFASAVINLDCAVVHLDGHWEKLKAMREKYGAKVKVFDPGYLGSVLISSEADDLTIPGLIKEFEFELLDPYLARSLACHNKR